MRANARSTMKFINRSHRRSKHTWKREVAPVVVEQRECYSLLGDGRRLCVHSITHTLCVLPLADLLCPLLQLVTAPVNLRHAAATKAAGSVGVGTRAGAGAGAGAAASYALISASRVVLYWVNNTTNAKMPKNEVIARVVGSDSGKSSTLMKRSGRDAAEARINAPQLPITSSIQRQFCVRSVFAAAPNSHSGSATVYRAVTTNTRFSFVEILSSASQHSGIYQGGQSRGGQVAK